MGLLMQRDSLRAGNDAERPLQSGPQRHTGRSNVHGCDVQVGSFMCVSDAGTAGRQGRMVAGRGDAVLRAAQNVEAEGLHRVQPLDLDQTGQEVWDAVSRRTDPVEELHAVAHAADLVALQPEALGEVPPRLDHGLVCAVGGAEHAAGALQTVERQLGRTQTCADEEHHHHHQEKH